MAELTLGEARELLGRWEHAYVELRGERNDLREEKHGLERRLDGWAIFAREANQVAWDFRCRARAKLEAVEAHCEEAACRECREHMDEACADDACNWARRILVILQGNSDSKDAERQPSKGGG